MNILNRAVVAGQREFKILVRKRKAKGLGLEYVEPNFIYLPRFNSDSVVVDVGCSYEADLSVFMMKKFHLQAFGIDPTRKHALALQQIATKSEGRFHHLPLAVSSTDGELTFYESEQNESGSICKNHSNVVNDKTRSYAVESVTLSTLLKRIGRERVDLLKLDIEGAEYRLLQDITKGDLAAFEQIFIEFHHHAVPEWNETDTQRIVNRVAETGFRFFSLDDHNYLFYRV